MKHKLSYCNGSVLDRTSAHPHTLSPGADAPIKEWTIKKKTLSFTNLLQMYFSTSFQHFNPTLPGLKKKKVEFQKSLSLECPKIHHRDSVA